MGTVHDFMTFSMVDALPLSVLALLRPLAPSSVLDSLTVSFANRLSGELGTVHDFMTFSMVDALPLSVLA
jgi:hypothetical protein